MVSDIWPAPPALCSLPPDEVHVWRARLDEPAERIAEMSALLTADEKERAERFYRPRDGDSFIVARGLLRLILGRYLDVSPSSLRFVKNEHGKPFLANDQGEQVSFNISHAGDLALLAFTRQRLVGVDIERLDAELDCQKLARRLFSASEAAQLARFTNAEERLQAFFLCWTRKEAYIKGQGDGMVLGLRSFDVTLALDEPARLVATRPDAGEALRWRLQNLRPAPGYAAALAVEGWDWQLRCWTWAERPAP